MASGDTTQREASANISESALVCPRCGTNWRPRTWVEMLQAARLTAIQGVFNEAEERLGLSLRDIQQRTMGKAYDRARGVAWVARELRGLGLTLKEIGQLMGNRHHSSIIHLIRMADKHSYPEFNERGEEAG